MTKSGHVAVVGGGVAGLAAAFRLAERGIRVTVFEAAPQLGGRARGVEYKGVKLDNGQHILLGAYKETLNLLKLAGVEETKVLLRLPLALHMINLGNKSTFSLKAFASLPAPLHLLFGLLFAKGLSAGSSFFAIKLMLWLKLQAFKLARDEPLCDFLQRKNQPQELIQNLWEPLCLAALNTPLTQASTQVFLNVLRASFDKKKSDSDLLLPRVDLGELFAEPIAAYIVSNGGEIKLNHAVKSIEVNNTDVHLTAKGVAYTFSQVIIACAPHQLAKIEVIKKNGEVISAKQSQLNYQPITTIYLQYADAVKLPQVLLGFVGNQDINLAQWVFDRGQLCGQNGLLAVIISAHVPFEMSQDKLAAKIMSELQSAFPHMGSPLWYKVITEKNATFSCDVGLTRPKAYLLDNVYLTGDYVAGEYPATIEGAVCNGLLVADCIELNLIINEY